MDNIKQPTVMPTNPFDDAPSVYNPFSSRKFLFAAGLSAASVGLLATRRLDATNWVNFNKYIFGAYILGNVSQKTFKMDLSNH